MAKQTSSTPRLSRQERDARIVADLLADLDNGGLPPWRMPWSKNMFRQCNAVTKKPYQGINMLITTHRAGQRNYGDHRWLTYRQAQAAGGHVRKGEHGTRVVFWKYPQRDQDSVPPCRRKRTTTAPPKSTKVSSCASMSFSTPARSKA